jgi:hypothetical protein
MLYLFSGFPNCPARRSTVGENPVETITDRELAVFPNPAMDKLTITIPNEIATGRASVRITDVYGRQIRRLNNVSNTTTMSTAGLTAGVYIVEVYADNKIILTKKIIKQ